MTIFVDPSDQSLWPKLNVGPGRLSAQNAARKRNNETFQPSSFDSDSLSLVDSFTDQVYVG